MAPVTLIVAHDLAFQERLPALFPHIPTARAMYDANPDLTRDTAFRNAVMQDAYLTM